MYSSLLQISVAKASTPVSDDNIPTQPPTVPDTTVTTLTPDTANPDKHWSLTVTANNGLSIPNNLRFYFWFVVATRTDSRGADAPGSYGPFVTESVADSSGAKLDIDVEKLKKPDGTAGSVPSGSYKIQFADADTGTTYVGTSKEVIAVKGTGESSSTVNRGSGGCDAGMGGVLALLIGTSLAVWRKKG
jgi:hypothetical protein